MLLEVNKMHNGKLKQNKTLKRIIVTLMCVMMAVSFGAVSVSATSKSLSTVSFAGNGSASTTSVTLPNKTINVNSSVSIKNTSNTTVNEKVTVELRRSRWYGSDLIVSGNATKSTAKKSTVNVSIRSTGSAPLNTNGYFCNCIASNTNKNHSTTFKTTLSY